MNPLILPFKPKNCIVEFEPHCKPAPSATNLYEIWVFYNQILKTHLVSNHSLFELNFYVSLM